jgi:hypothetical protein
MGDQDYEKKKDQIRVVEDLEVSSEDVIRLDEPKRGALEKKGRISSAALLSPPTEENGKNEKPANPFDPEGEWIEELETKEQKVVPMGWFVLLGVIMLGILGWVVIQSITSPDEEKKSVGISADGGPLGKVAEIEAQKVAEAHYRETENVLKGFLEAETLEGKLKYVRHAARVRPLMKEYYERNQLKPIQFKQILEYRMFPLENYPFLALKVELENGVEEAVLVEDSGAGQLVDWESFVCYQEISIDDYVARRPTRSVTIRAYVTEDYFHSYDFESVEKYASYKLKFRHSEVIMNAYVERGTELEQKFLKMFPKGSKKRIEPLILKVHFLEGGRSSRSVLIEDLVSRKWAYPENPAGIASQDNSQ